MKRYRKLERHFCNQRIDLSVVLDGEDAAVFDQLAALHDVAREDILAAFSDAIKLTSATARSIQEVALVARVLLLGRAK